MISTLVQRYVKENKINVFRRAYIKRMQTDGTFEADWFEITKHVKKWGRISQNADSDRYNKVSFRSSNITVDNSEGKFLDETDVRSYWFGYATQQRTLIRIEAGYVKIDHGADGIYDRQEAPGALWDVSVWDGETWDSEAIQFMGILNGDIPLSDSYEVNLNVMPLLEVLRAYPATELSGFTSTGVTASRFCEILRDQTDGSGNYVFRPFFGDTTTNWNIQTTTEVYSQLSTSTAEDLINSKVWDLVEKLAEAEQFVAWVSGDGMFNFTSRDANTSTSAFQFFGLGVPNREYGQTIKKIDKYAKAFSKFYSRVSVQYRQDDTTTSYEIQSSPIEVAGDNLAWLYGSRTLQIANFWITGATAAASIALNTYTEVSAVKREIAFTTVFIPGLSIFDQINVSYDPATTDDSSLWDVNNWADTAGAAPVDGDLVWDAGTGDSFFLDAEEMKIIAIELDLDRLENRITARET